MCICTCTFFFSFYIPTATVGSGKRGICSDRSDLNTCRPVRMLSPVQSDTTLLANNSQHCCMSHVASVCTPSQSRALRKIEGIPVLWTCKIQGAQWVLQNYEESKIFWSLSPERKFKAVGHQEMLEHSLALLDVVAYFWELLGKVSNW